VAAAAVLTEEGGWFLNKTQKIEPNAPFILGECPAWIWWGGPEDIL